MMATLAYAFLLLPALGLGGDGAASAPVHAAPAKKTVRLFILSGQSNAAGNGNGEELSGADAIIDPEVLIYRGTPDEIVPMAPLVLDKPVEKFNIQRLIFGPELSFAHEMKKAYPNDLIAVAKVSIRGGTSIVAWEKDHTRPGWREELRAVANEDAVFLPEGKVRHLYQDLVDETRQAIQLLQQRPDVERVLIEGMLWVQNENDAKQEQSAKNYKAHLIQLIQNVRTDLAMPKMPFLFMDVHQELTPPRVLLKEKLREVVNEVPVTALVSADGLAKYPGVHFNTKGMLGLGRRFAASYQDLVSATTSQPATVKGKSVE